MLPLVDAVVQMLLLVAILVVVGAILHAVKMGFSEVIKGLQAIHDELKSGSS